MRIERLSAAILAGALIALLGVVPSLASDKGKLTKAEAGELGIEAFVYGFPLVLMDITKQVQTNVAEPQHNGRAPVNQFSHFPKLPTAADKDAVRMNVDTLYSFAWLDLSKEPIVLSVPDTDWRYYMLPVIDAWTNVASSPGKRTSGTKPARFVIVGPNWKGTLPEGINEVKSPTNMAFIAGQTQANGPADEAAVNALQKQYELTPLSALGKPYEPPKGTVDPKVDMKTPPLDQVGRMSAATFFKTLAELMKSNPPSAADAPILEKFARIGITPGQDFDMKKLDPVVAKGLEKSVREAMSRLEAKTKKTGKSVNGWSLPPRNLGNFGTDYDLRAATALAGRGADIAQDAISLGAFEDARGHPMSGVYRCVLHFDKDKMPPANAFWSVTLYDHKGHLVSNSINRYHIASWMPLEYNPDGSLDIRIQHDPPGNDKEPNWLPAAPGQFSVTMRIYWPKESVLDSSWTPPAIQRLKSRQFVPGMRVPFRR